MHARTYTDNQGDPQDERRSQRPLRGLPPWVDYIVIVGLISLCFWAGVQANRLDTISKQLDVVQNQLTVVNANDPKAQLAVLQEKSHESDQAISDLKDTLLRRLDRMEAKLEQVPAGGRRY